MQACLERHFKKLSRVCKAVVDRIRSGEKVPFF
jgi:hypothetical protein